MRVESQDVLQSIRRWYNGESREKNLSSIANIVDSAFAQLEMRVRKHNPTPSDKVFVIRLKEEMRTTMRGLQNLQTTYERDSVAEARIDVLLDRIRAQLQQFEIMERQAEGDDSSSEEALIDYDG